VWTGLTYGGLALASEFLLPLSLAILLLLQRVLLVMIDRGIPVLCSMLAQRSSIRANIQAVVDRSNRDQA